MVGAIAIGTYTLAVPNMGKIDPKNSWYYLASNVFDFYGVISLEPFCVSKVTGDKVGTFMNKVLISPVFLVCFSFF